MLGNNSGDARIFRDAGGLEKSVNYPRRHIAKIFVYLFEYISVSFDYRFFVFPFP